MNNIYISHNSAFLVYRYLRITRKISELSISNFKQIYNSASCVKNFDLDKLFENSQRPSKLDLLVGNKNNYYQSPNINFHVLSKKLPANSFLKIEDGVYITCPELTYCQIAHNLDLSKLIILGMEMCGSFAVSVDENVSLCCDLSPLSSVEKIVKYIESLRKVYSGFWGLKNASIASKFIKNGSASPQESRLYYLLCGPTSNGGFGIKNMQLNKKIILSSKAKEVCGQSFITPDICNPQKKIAIEYDSDEFHDNSMQNRRDKLRSNALSLDG